MLVGPHLDDHLEGEGMVVVFHAFSLPSYYSSRFSGITEK